MTSDPSLSAVPVDSLRWREIADVFRGARRVAVTTHIHPDGDALGSAMALVRLLEFVGVASVPLLSDAAPENLRFLDPDGETRVAGDPRVEAALASADVIAVVDVSMSDRLGRLMNPVLAASGRRVCIDHHTDGDFPAAPALIDPSASSTGELIYELARSMLGDRPLPIRIAEPLYVAIMTDTGGFRYSNTSARTHRVVADLIDAGVKPERVYRDVYHKARPETLRLLGLALGGLSTDVDGRLAWIDITQERLALSGARQEDVDGFVELPRTLKGVEVVILFMELASGKVKVSMRSREGVNVHQVAAQFGGGGHVHAAGILMAGPWPASREAVLKAVRTALGSRSA